MHQTHLNIFKIKESNETRGHHLWSRRTIDSKCTRAARKTSWTASRSGLEQNDEGRRNERSRHGENDAIYEVAVPLK